MDLFVPIARNPVAYSWSENGRCCIRHLLAAFDSFKWEPLLSQCPVQRHEFPTFAPQDFGYWKAAPFVSKEGL